MLSKYLYSILFIFLSLFIFAQMKAEEKPVETKFPEAGAFANTKLIYKIINTAHSTFCYDIFADGKLVIHQPSIPGMPGNEGFKTKAAAESIADLVIKKMKKGEMPPTVTIEELKKLKAIPN